MLHTYNIHALGYFCIYSEDSNYIVGCFIVFEKKYFLKEIMPILYSINFFSVKLNFGIFKIFQRMNLFQPFMQLDTSENIVCNCTMYIHTYN